MKLNTDLTAFDVMLDAIEAARTSPALTIGNRILDRLADALLEIDMVLDLLQVSDASGLEWTVAHVKTAYDEIDCVMKALTD